MLIPLDGPLGLRDRTENICNLFKDKLEIIYIKNQNNRGNGPSNTNNAISHADG